MAKNNDRLGVTHEEQSEALAAEVDRSARRDDGSRDQQRQSLAAEQERQYNEEERLQMFLETFANSALPQLPPIPGYHLCWLSTTNSKDTIHARLRIGYELVRPEEVIGWSNLKLNNGEFAGYVGVNEMVLAKLADGLYQRFMTHLHHKLPLDEAAKLRYRAEELKSQAQGYGADVEIGEGIMKIDQHVRAPARKQMFE